MTESTNREGEARPAARSPAGVPHPEAPSAPGPEPAAPDHQATDGNPVRQGVSRRSLLRRGLLVGAGAVGGGLVGGFSGHAIAAGASAASEAEPFWGVHQTGILTNTQSQTVLAAFDVGSRARSDLVALLKAWSDLASKLVLGRSVPIPIYRGSGSANAGAGAAAASHYDSLEAYGLGPQRLTVTIGFGRSLFVDDHGTDRFGLAGQLPAALIDLPVFPGDELDPAQSGGDLFLQACADDAQVAFHAVRSVARIAPDVARLRWTQVGFSPHNDGGTPRNVMGFKDGTIDSNLHPPADLDATVWAGDEGPTWMAGGSYLVYRRIRVNLEQWDRLDPQVQDRVFGRRKLDGALLGQANEFSPLDPALKKRDAAGNLVIPTDAHVRLAAPESNDGAVILRQGFSYDNGTIRFQKGSPLEYDAGLLFFAYQKDPRRGFVPLFSSTLSGSLSQFTTHTASAVFAVAPGARGPGDWVGRTLLIGP